MAAIVPNAAEAIVAADFLANGQIIKLFSNNYTPIETSTVAAFTEVAGGGYAQIELAFADWTITPGAPTVALAAQEEFVFTGATTAPSTIYGYYVVDAVDPTILLWAERFAVAVVPYTPIAGSKIRITPKVQVS